MKSDHSYSRLLISLILLMVAVAFLAGSLRLFHEAQAAVSPAETSLFASPPTTTIVHGPKSIADGSSNKVLAVSFQAGTSLPPKGTPVASVASADTSGIIALAIVIVVIILVGATWGARNNTRNKKSSH